MIDICSDCGVKEGDMHLENCDQEKCSKCAKQVLGWGKCVGAEPEPFFRTICFHCERCDEYMPKMFMVSKEEWKEVCGGTYPLTCVLCKSCFDFVKKIRRINGYSS